MKAQERLSLGFGRSRVLAEIPNPGVFLPVIENVMRYVQLVLPIFNGNDFTCHGPELLLPPFLFREECRMFLIAREPGAVR